MKKKNLGFLCTLAIALAGASSAQAKTSVNSMCYMNAKDSSKKIEGNNTRKKFELASTSKVVTAYWAVSKLGAKYRFKTKLHVRSLGNDTYDVHVEGDKDPYFGQEMTYFMASELAKNGIRKIERLSFDENLEVNWKVHTSGNESARSYDPSADQVRSTLENAFVSGTLNAKAYAALAKDAKALYGIEMAKDANLKVRRVEFAGKDSRQNAADEKVLVLKSAPLYRLIKEMNLHSNNYVADMLFRRLGGADRFHEFASSKMQLDRDDLTFVNGSGDSVITDDGKLYNKASCETMIKVLFALRAELNKQDLDLKDVMSVAGSDNSTLGKRYAGLEDSVVAKTGSVNPGITLSGMVSTEEGEFLFTVLMKTDGPADWTKARNKIRELVGKLISDHGGQKDLSYKRRAFLPFDASSTLQSEVASDKN